MSWEPMTPDELAAWESELRACIGVPWRHMGRQACGYGHQTGLDCVGLLVRGAVALGREVRDLEAYAREPDGTLRARLSEHLGAPCEPGPGCIVLMRLPREPTHVGYITSAGTLIHAYNGGQKVVVEHPLGLWAGRIVKGWAL